MNIYNKLPEDLQYYMIDFIKERFEFRLRDKRAIFTKSNKIYNNLLARRHTEMGNKYSAYLKLIKEHVSFLAQQTGDEKDIYHCSDCYYTEHCDECCPCELCDVFE